MENGFSLEEWNNAKLASDTEQRIAPNGNVMNRSEFRNKYGGLFEWEVAPAASIPSSATIRSVISQMAMDQGRESSDDDDIMEANRLAHESSLQRSKTAHVQEKY